jgi:hypothetical protein
MPVELPNGCEWGRIAMQASMCISALCVVLIGCAPEPTTVPWGTERDTTPPRAFYVSPAGRSDGDGTAQRPWDLATAFAHPASVEPGDTIWLRGGTYRGAFLSRIVGAPSAPIVVRQYPGERASIDGDLRIRGGHTWYWGFERLVSDPARITSQPGSAPTDIPARTIGVYGPDIKLINLIIHDGSAGIFAGIDALRLEIYGSLIYNVGWEGPDRGHGHGLYLQNRDDIKRVVDNVVYNTFAYGLQLGGTDQTYLWNFHVEGNAVFGSGSADAVHGPQFNIRYIGAGGNLGRSTFLRNSLYHNGRRQVAEFGANLYPPGEDLQFVENTVQGEVRFQEWYRFTIRGNKIALGDQPGPGGISILMGFQYLEGVSLAAHGHRVDQNSYANVTDAAYEPLYKKHNGDAVGTAYNLSEWRAATGYDLQSTHHEGPVFPVADVIVRPNRYERGRAFIYCWNWLDASALSVDVSTVLSRGDRYQLHHVYDVFGPPIATGTYSGAALIVPQTGYIAPIPTGYPTRPPSASPRFNVFLLRKVD